jgi:tyrosyl-tRNA synthetase
MDPASDFLQKITLRGYFNQCTHEEELDKILQNKKISAYIGFDCTAESLHIGSLIQIMILRYLQKSGHRPIILLGQGTTKIGDPSGKDESRKILDEERINSNMLGIKKTLEKFDLSKENPNLPSFEFVNNNDWLKDLNYIEFLQEFGRHFSINRMLTFDSVKLRLDRQQSLSFLEFNYMILQAYDFYKLNNSHNCILQIGGSDQWGNIVNGVELTRRLSSATSSKKDNVYGLTSPLLTTKDGKKMGKTANGAIWLDAKMLEPFEYFQYFRNIDDKEATRFLKLFTEFSIEEIRSIEAKDINEQKKILAFEATKICHGIKAATEAAKKAEEIFSNQDNIENLPLISLTFNQEEIIQGKMLTSILKEENLCSSLGEARRLIKGGGIKIDDQKINEEAYLVKINKNQTHLKLSLGKKKFFKITINN